MDSKSLFPLFLSLLVGCTSQPLNPLVPFQTFWWEEAPKVRVCEDSPASLEQVIEDLIWWYDLNPAYTVASVDTGPCEFRAPRGWIYVKQEDPIGIFEQAGAAGLTDWEGQSTGAMTSATVMLLPDADLVLEEEVHLRILRHEMGHAWGWCHAGPGHIMGGGESSAGMEEYGKPTKEGREASFEMCVCWGREDCYVDEDGVKQSRSGYEPDTGAPSMCEGINW